MAQSNYTIRRGGKLLAGRVRLAGSICGTPQYVIGVRNACRIEVDVAGESYYIQVKPSRKLWDLELGTPIVAIGRLVHDTVTVESHGFHLGGPAVRPGIIEL